MLTTSDKREQLDEMLEMMASGVQLDKTRYERMVQTYEAIQKWIEEDELFFKPFKYDVYPHGSVRIGTTVKPYASSEFDLDIAIHLLTTGIQHTPARMYLELKRRLAEHAKYKEIIELKNRCIRLNYAGDFHLDILPGIQEFTWDANRLKVPDRELNRWVSSNPRGYAEWFLQRAALNKQSLLQKVQLRAENIPANRPEMKKPLQYAVQLIKRYRDMYFAKVGDSYKTSSIVLTTLAGNFYSGEDSIFDTIDAFITATTRHFSYNIGRIKVLNPVNADEDFTDKWENEPAYYDAFRAFCFHLQAQWQELKRGQGRIAEAAVMKDLFGSELYTKAELAQAEKMEELRHSKSLRIDRPTGMLTSAATMASSAINKMNTFYGDL